MFLAYMISVLGWVTRMHICPLLASMFVRLSRLTWNCWQKIKIPPCNHGKTMQSTFILDQPALYSTVQCMVSTFKPLKLKKIVKQASSLYGWLPLFLASWRPVQVLLRWREEHNCYQRQKLLCFQFSVISFSLFLPTAMPFSLFAPANK